MPDTRGKYPPGGKWIHDRAHRILEKGDLQETYGADRAKQVAYALANQQAHKLGKTPKKGAGPRGVYGTAEGKKQAKVKYSKPEADYRKTAGLSQSVKKILHKIFQYWDGEEKTANLSGRDNRTPFVGQTQFPTEGSKSFSKKLHTAATGKAEVGPAPLMGKLDKTKMVPLQSVTPKTLTTKGMLPMAKTGSRIENDPLVQYLQKHAKSLEDNANAMAEQKPEKPLQDKRTETFEEKPDELEALFAHSSKPNL